MIKIQHTSRLASLLPLPNAGHIKSVLRHWLLRIRRLKPQKRSITKPLGSLSGKLPEQGPSISPKLARSLRATRPELISFGRSQWRHLATAFASAITHRKWHLGPHGKRESRSPGRSFCLKLDFGWPRNNAAGHPAVPELNAWS